MLSSTDITTVVGGLLPEFPKTRCTRKDRVLFGQCSERKYSKIDTTIFQSEANLSLIYLEQVFHVSTHVKKFFCVIVGNGQTGHTS